MYAKKCGKVAQENSGIDSLKVMSFISHDSLYQQPVFVQGNGLLIRSNSFIQSQRCDVICSEKKNLSRLFEDIYVYFSFRNIAVAYAES